MSRRTEWYEVANISEDSAASIFRTDDSVLRAGPFSVPSAFRVLLHLSESSFLRSAPSSALEKAEGC
jgi:hypothetical protein